MNAEVFVKGAKARAVTISGDASGGGSGDAFIGVVGITSTFTSSKAVSYAALSMGNLCIDRDRKV